MADIGLWVSHFWFFRRRAHVILCTLLLLMVAEAHPRPIAVERGLEVAARHYSAGDVGGALRVLDDLVAKFPGEPEVHFAIASYQVAFQGMDREQRIIRSVVTENARQHLEIAIELCADDIRYKALYAVLLEDFREHKTAILVFSEIFADPSNRTHSDYRYLVISYAAALRDAGAFEEGVRQYELSLSATPRDERIAVGYVGFLGAAHEFERIERLHAETDYEQGHRERLWFAVCYEAAALSHTDFAAECFSELSRGKWVSKRLRGDAEERYLALRRQENTLRSTRNN